MNAEKPSSLNKVLHKTERVQNDAHCPITSMTRTLGVQLMLKSGC